MSPRHGEKVGGRINFFRKKRRYKKSLGPRRPATRIASADKNCYYLADREYYRKVYLKTDHWKDLKRRKLELVNSCEDCETKKYLDVHHLVYRNLYDVELDDLVVLCRRCHKAEHKKSEEKDREYRRSCLIERHKIHQDNLRPAKH